MFCISHLRNTHFSYNHVHQFSMHRNMFQNMITFFYLICLIFFFCLVRSFSFISQNKIFAKISICFWFNFFFSYVRFIHISSAFYQRREDTRRERERRVSLFICSICLCVRALPLSGFYDVHSMCC